VQAWESISWHDRCEPIMVKIPWRFDSGIGGDFRLSYAKPCLCRSPLNLPFASSKAMWARSAAKYLRPAFQTRREELLWCEKRGGQSGARS